MRRSFHYASGRPHRIADGAHARHGTSLTITAIHDYRIHLYAAIARKHRAAAGIKQRVVFHTGNNLYHGVQAATARAQYGVASFERYFQTFNHLRLKLAQVTVAA
jgi:hypothetical protein